MQQGRLNTWLSFRSARPSEVAQFSVGANKYKLHADDELFEKAYSYIRQYY
jgi:hypothetical protein